jgi:hypothetical protein
MKISPHEKDLKNQIETVIDKPLNFGKNESKTRFCEFTAKNRKACLSRFRDSGSKTCDRKITDLSIPKCQGTFESCVELASTGKH